MTAQPQTETRGNILLTGGSGYIGSHTAIALLNAGYDVTIIDNFYNSYALVLERIELLTGKKIKLFVEGDVTKKEDLQKAFVNPVDCVVHFAGLKAVGESVSIPNKYYQNNVVSTMTLCDVMKEHGCKRIIFSSSATVYKPTEEANITEDFPLGCSNPYGWSKLFSEQIIQDLCHAWKEDNFGAVLLRYFNPVGNDASGIIGESPKGIPNNLVPYIQQVAIGKREFLGVFGDDYDTPDGTGVRDYIHVEDLASGHLKAVEYCLRTEGNLCEAINLGTGDGYSVLEMLKSFEKACGKELAYKVVDRRPGDLARCVADPSKAEKLLGWKAERTLDECMASGWKWQWQNPDGFDTKNPVVPTNLRK